MRNSDLSHHRTYGSVYGGSINLTSSTLFGVLELRKMPLLSLNDNEYYIVTNSKFAYEVEDNKDIETIRRTIGKAVE